MYTAEDVVELRWQDVCICQVWVGGSQEVVVANTLDTEDYPTFSATLPLLLHASA